MKKTKIVITYETDTMINLELLKEQEPELFEELSKDYPVNEGTYIYEVKKGA